VPPRRPAAGRAPTARGPALGASGEGPGRGPVTGGSSLAASGAPQAGDRPAASPRHPRVAAARRLTRRAHRQTDGRFLVEGLQGVREALALVESGEEPGALAELLVTPDAADRHADLVARAARVGVPVLPTSPQALAQLADTVTPQGLVGVAPLRDVPLASVLGRTPPPALVAVLAAVRDPGNAGTVIRTADAAGADAVVLTDDSVDIHNGKAVRASVGSLFHLPVAAGAPSAEAVAGLRRAGLTVLAADGGDPEARDLDELAASGGLAGPTAWLFGNEAWGLTPEVRGLADMVVAVPIHGRAESLNLATAAAVCLYASAGAQRAPGGCRAPR
jgi:TrmH family RNA methyltransferase